MVMGLAVLGMALCGFVVLLLAACLHAPSGDETRDDDEREW